MRRVLIGIASALLLAVLVLSGFLLEAHLEMRSIAPALPSRAALEGVPEGPVRIRYVNSGTQIQSTGRGGTYGGFLLEWPDGSAFAIDVGMAHEGMQAFGDVLESIGAQPIETFGSMAEQLGADSKRIAAVGFTHLHTDHTEGIAELCAAHGGTIPVFQTPDQLQRGNYTTDPGRAQLSGSGCTEPRELSGGPLMPIPSFEGLAAFAAGGHTPGSTVFVANVAGKHWIFAGDITNDRENLFNDVGKPWLYSNVIIPESTGRLGELRRWLTELYAPPATEIVISHDLDSIRATAIEIWGEALR